MDLSVMQTAMMASISEVLEQMFFLPVDGVTAEPKEAVPAQDLHAVAATLDFEGAFKGRFRLWMDSAMAKSISADFLGVEPDTLSDSQITDTVKEMINMLGGSTLSNYDHSAVFNLGIPMQADGATAPTETASPQEAISLVANTLESSIRYRLSVC